MELTIKSEKKVNVSAPLYYKKPNEYKYRGLLREDHYINFSHTEDGQYTKGWSSYYNGDGWLSKSDLAEAFDTWEPISEEDFIRAHEAFLSLQSLKPVLISNNPDDLTGIL